MMSSTINTLNTVNTLLISAINYTVYIKRTCSLELVPTHLLNFFIITNVITIWQL